MEIMSLGWNKHQRNLLASGSADKTVKLWDLQTQKCLRTYKHHTDKVQAVLWNNVETSVLLTGAFDRTAQLFDTRNPEAIARWTFAADVECLCWDPFEPHVFFARCVSHQIVVSIQMSSIYLCNGMQYGPHKLLWFAPKEYTKEIYFFVWKWFISLCEKIGDILMVAEPSM